MLPMDFLVDFRQILRPKADLKLQLIDYLYINTKFL